MMDLFNQTDELRNILPKDGTVHHYGFAFSRAEADSYYSTFLKNIVWRNDEIVMYGKRIVTQRKIAWYVEDKTKHSYDTIVRNALPFTDELSVLKQKMEALTGETYNSCLLNLYHNGSEGLSWHSDGEDFFEKNGAIASITFGAERKFSFKHKDTKEVVSLILEHGSVLVMKDETQLHWLHSLPATKKVLRPRVNLTFRTLV